MTYDESKRSRSEAIKKVSETTHALRNAVKQLQEVYPARVKICLSEDPPTVMKSWVYVEENNGTHVITADTQAHAEEHAAQLEADGATCTSTGETQVTCEPA